MPKTQKPMWAYSEYSEWGRQLALGYTRKELEKQVLLNDKELRRASESHRRAIEKTTSMQSNSQWRAHASNSVSYASTKMFALHSALEIYTFYPEKTKEGMERKNQVNVSSI